MTDLTLSDTEREHLTAASRFDAIRNLIREAEQMRLTACALLAEAEQHHDWAQLGYETMTEYITDGLGLPQSTGSKMLNTGRIFVTNMGAPAWMALPPADQAELSVDRLYEAAKMVEEGRWTPEEALHEAVANSADKIRDVRVGRESFATHRCSCPNCGNEHFAPNTEREDPPF